jgi:hypothetical protein
MDRKIGHLMLFGETYAGGLRWARVQARRGAGARAREGQKVQGFGSAD